MHWLPDVHAWTLCFWPALVTNWLALHETQRRLLPVCRRGDAWQQRRSVPSTSPLLSLDRSSFGQNRWEQSALGGAQVHHGSPLPGCFQGQNRWQGGQRAAWCSISLPGRKFPTLVPRSPLNLVSILFHQNYSPPGHINPRALAIPSGP